MDDANQKKAARKQRAVRELLDYWITFAYLVLFFGLFTWYRRLTLAEYHIVYLHYGVAVIEALVLAKVILIGRALRLGRRLEDKPLIFSTLYKSAVFAVFVGLFEVVEHTLDGLLRHQGLAAGVQEIWQEGRDELVARCLVTFAAFIPFFAFQEVERVLGEGRILKLFFHKRLAPEPGPSAQATG